MKNVLGEKSGMRYFTSCLKRLFGTPGFWVAVAGTVVLSLFSPLYYNVANGSSLSILEVCMEYKEEALLDSTEFCSYAVFRRGFGAWLRMFVPVIVSLASVNLKADEYNSSAWRNYLYRAGKPAYNVGGCLFYLLSGGLVLVLGYSVFGLAVKGMFPGLGRFSVENRASFVQSRFGQGSFMGWLYGIGGFPLAVAAYLLEIFLYGMEQSAAAMFLSLFTENKYILICTPFFLRYLISQAASLFPYMAMSKNPQLSLSSLSAYNDIANTWNPEALLTLFENPTGFWGVIFLHIGYLTAASLLYCLISLKKRREA